MARWGRFVVARPWWVIGGWLGGVIAILAFLPSLSDITSGDQGSFLPDSYESVQAVNLANILMIARLREEARDGEEPRAAAALGVEHAGPSVAAAGLILAGTAGTFGALALAPVSFLQQIGFSVAVGILLSGFVMSMFLVPALTALIGHPAWWPGHGDARSERPGERSADAEPPADAVGEDDLVRET